MNQNFSFVSRHNGANSFEQAEMLKALELTSLNDLIEKTIPKQIRTQKPLRFEKGGDSLAKPYEDESDVIHSLKTIAEKNKIFKSYIGQGYYGCHTPKVILRNVLENPGWYTQYTPYQAEIAQGRLEALLNFQTMVCNLTGLEMSNASLLDEATAAAEAMAMVYAIQGKSDKKFLVSKDCFPQTIDVILGRAEALGVDVEVKEISENTNFAGYFGAIFQNPNQLGLVKDLTLEIENLHKTGGLAIVAADILSLCIHKTPGEMGADIAVGSTQRFGVPMGFGGPHAAYLACKDQFKRVMPGRIVGVSKDAEGNPAIRLALQTREQHIRREKATSNICTSQVLLAVMASFYAVYHGPEGLKQIAWRVKTRAEALRKFLKKNGTQVIDGEIFDTVMFNFGTQSQAMLSRLELAKINVRHINLNDFSVSLDETTTIENLTELAAQLVGLTDYASVKKELESLIKEFGTQKVTRNKALLEHPVFNRYHTETEMLRYITRLQSKDLSLAQSMIALGSCTMKLNATSEMIPVTWPEFGNIHPFAPAKQTQGYAQMISELESMLCDITGFDAVSCQPNAGSQGEYAGLLVIRAFQKNIGQSNRNICLIPASAHGTNPASAAMAGMSIVVVKCDTNGNIDIEDLKQKAELHKENLSALMVTYPSTHGVFEASISQICEIIHACGGQVYMDGANLNAMVGLCKPAEIGADVCHMNLHKTFCIPHGGGGPGMGPIGVRKHLAEFLPGHIENKDVTGKKIRAVSAAPNGSASILPISWMYLKLMGAEGVTQATRIAILNANYVAKKLDSYFPVLYKGENGMIAHECILDLRPLKALSGVEVEDVAKRLMDYGFHAPTVSFPVAGTMMIEPTESESKAELDRFCDAMISIHGEIQEIIDGKADKLNNVLKKAPHTASVLCLENWDRPYSRQKAVYPRSWVKERKFWPAVSRIDQVYGERNLMCTCLPVSEYE